MMWIRAIVYSLLGISIIVHIQQTLLVSDVWESKTVVKAAPSSLGTELRRTPQTKLAPGASNSTSKRSKKDRKQQTTIVFGGDLLLSVVQQEGKPRQLSSCEKNDEINWLGRFGTLRQSIIDADAIFASLTTPLSSREVEITRLENGWHKGSSIQPQGFSADPDSCVSILKSLQVTAVALANNRMLDVPTGVLDTISVLDEAGIGHAGAGATLRKAMQPFTTRVANRSIAMLSAADLRSINDGKTASDETREYVLEVAASEDRRGVWDLHTSDLDSITLNFNDADFEPIRAAVAKVRAKVTFLVMYLHWQPDRAGHIAGSSFKRMAERLVDAGVDVVVGTHPHHVQGIHVYKGHPIIMGAGEMLRGFRQDTGWYPKVNYLDEIVYRFAMVPSLNFSRGWNLDFLLVRNDPDSCQSNLMQGPQLDEMRQRIREINPAFNLFPVADGLRLSYGRGVPLFRKQKPGRPANASRPRARVLPPVPENASKAWLEGWGEEKRPGEVKKPKAKKAAGGAVKQDPTQLMSKLADWLDNSGAVLDRRAAP